MKPFNNVQKYFGILGFTKIKRSTNFDSVSIDAINKFFMYISFISFHICVIHFIIYETETFEDCTEPCAFLAIILLPTVSAMILIQNKSNVKMLISDLTEIIEQSEFIRVSGNNAKLPLTTNYLINRM